MPDIDFSDLVLAYRRAKVDLYYRAEPRALDLLAYEETLSASLESLRDRIQGEDGGWVNEAAFAGTFFLSPKTAKRGESPSDSIIWSDPAEKWLAGADNGAEAEFRLMARCSIDMHVLSTLWMMTVGDRLDDALSRVAYGSRLKRTRTGLLNRTAPSSFKWYPALYGRWRDGALLAMRTALEDGKAVLALTADATAFYHRLDPIFLLDEEFLASTAGINLTPWEQDINRLFVGGLLAWADAMNVETGWRPRGLPVGLPASGVVANLALIELDQLATQNLDPLFYGRYVDDIILVLDDQHDLRDAADVWDWIIVRSGGLLSRAREMPNELGQGANTSIRFIPPYLNGSDVEFKNAKNKVFHLKGSSGLFLLNSIRSTIDKNTSAWRALPIIPSNRGQVGAEVLVALRDDGEPAATLREADRVAARRSAFAFRLRDFEAYGRDLDRESWVTQRLAFFEALTEQVIRDPESFFELATYVPRILQLAVACEDWVSLANLVNAIVGTYELLATNQRVDAPAILRVKEYDELGGRAELIAQKWRDYLYAEVYESIAGAMAFMVGEVALADVTTALSRLENAAPAALTPTLLRDLHGRLFVHDLAHAPFRNALLGGNLTSLVGLPDSETLRRYALVESPAPGDPIAAGLDLLAERLRQLDRGFPTPPRADAPGSVALGERPGSAVPSFAFATRPFSVLELYLLFHGLDQGTYAYDHSLEIGRMVRSLRGYLPATLPTRNDRVISIPGPTVGRTKRIALAMLETDKLDSLAAAMASPNLNRGRYDRISRLLNELISWPQGSDYLLFPELAIPSRWFVRFAWKLRERRISLISGIEHQRGLTSDVHNQVWAALAAGSMPFHPYTVYRQDKQKPAVEEQDLLAEIGVELEPEVRWDRPYVVEHGDFRFSLLICSELTNIDYRSSVRGEVDALFVPAWNKDLHTFEALIESAALDVHAFIAMSNSRQYGDSRIRAPMAEPHKRDVLRLRGGLHDYIVVETIDYGSLRAHQSTNRAREPFKPTPDGFKIAEDRRTHP